MASYERPSVPQGGIALLRATPLQDSVTQVQIYQGGTANTPGSGTLVATIPGGSVTVSGSEYLAQWQTATNQALGAYYDDWTYVFGGVTQPVVRLAGITVVAATVLGTGVPPGYPYSYGYCQEADVQANIPPSAWNPASVGYTPTTAQVNAWITQGAADIDMVLARAGYTIPLVPASGYSVIDPRVYSRLLDINAALTTARVLSALHGASDVNEDAEAKHWYTYADDYLVRIERGVDNFTVFGVDGIWRPEPNKGKAFYVGGLTDPVTGDTTSPFFTRNGPSRAPSRFP